MQIWLPFPYPSLQGLPKPPFRTHGSKHAGCLHPLPPHTRHRSYRLHQRLVSQRPGELHDLPCTHGVVTLHAPRTCSHPLITPPVAIARSGYARICTSNQWQQHLLDIARPPPQLPSSPRRRCSSFPSAAMAPLFIVPPVESSQVERQTVKRRAILPMIVLGLGLNLKPRPSWCG